MHRFVGRSTIVAVALATTLGASAALADTTGITSEAIKSALSSTRTVNPSFANAATSTFNAERFARYEAASGDQSLFGARQSSAPASARVGILAPEHNGDIQFAQAGALTPQHNGDIQFVRRLAARPANAAFGDTAGECESAPVKLANVGMAMRELSNEPSLTEGIPSYARALQQPESTGALSGYKRFAANDTFQRSSGFSTQRTYDTAGLVAALKK